MCRKSNFAKKYERHKYDKDKCGCSKIRLEKNEDESNKGEKNGQGKSLELARPGRSRPRKGVRKQQNKADFSKFGRLEGKSPDLKPSMGSGGRLSPEKRKKKQEERRAMKQIGISGQQLIVDGNDDKKEKQAGEQPVELF